MLPGPWPPVGPTSRFRRCSALGHYLVSGKIMDVSRHTLIIFVQGFDSVLMLFGNLRFDHHIIYINHDTNLWLFVGMTTVQYAHLYIY